MKEDKKLQQAIKKLEKGQIRPEKFKGFKFNPDYQYSLNFQTITEEMFWMSDACLRILLFVNRQTAGWGKLVDKISITQFSEGIERKDGSFFIKGTKLPRRRVIAGIKEATLKGYLKKIVACPECKEEVPQEEVEYRKSHQPEKSVPFYCRCGAKLRGRETVFYGLNYAVPNDKEGGVVTERNQGWLRSVTRGSYENELDLVTERNSQELITIVNIQESSSIDDDIVNTMIELGFTKSRAKKYVKRYGADHVRNQIEKVKAKKDIQNRGGYLNELLKSGSTVQAPEDGKWFSVERKRDGKVIKIWRDGSGSPMKTKDKYYVGKLGSEDILVLIEDICEDGEYRPVGWDPRRFL
jgi:hypothetical protein